MAPCCSRTATAIATSGFPALKRPERRSRVNSRRGSPSFARSPRATPMASSTTRRPRRRTTSWPPGKTPRACCRRNLATTWATRPASIPAPATSTVSVMQARFCDRSRALDHRHFPDLCSASSSDASSRAPETPHLRNTAAHCDATVRTETPRRCAISAWECPTSSSEATSHSDAVRRSNKSSRRRTFGAQRPNIEEVPNAKVPIGPGSPRPSPAQRGPANPARIEGMRH
jgi:hypothetical protein